MAPAPKHTMQEQETLIIEAAVACIERSSLLDFTMSAISREAGLSMGSIYKHIQSKEDVLVLLATQVEEALNRAFTQIFSLPLRTIERMIAVHLFDHEKVIPFSFGTQLQMLVNNAAILKRASPDCLDTMIQANIRVEELFQQVLQEACANHELLVSDDEKGKVIEEIIVGNWSLCVGHSQAAMQRDTRNLAGYSYEMPFPLNPDSTVIQNAIKLLNSYPWQQKLTQQQVIDVSHLLKTENLL